MRPFLLSLFLGGLAGAVAQGTEECPRTAREWETFRNDIVRELLDLGIPYRTELADLSTVRRHYPRRRLERLRHCLTESPAGRACTSRLETFLQYTSRYLPDRTVALPAPGAATALPAFLGAPAFLALVSRGDMAGARAYVRTNGGDGIVALEYPSRVAARDIASGPGMPAVAAGHRRRSLVIYLPGTSGGPDLWFNVSPPGGDARRAAIAYMSVRRIPGRRAETEFAEQLVESQPRGAALRRPDASDRCTECHRNNAPQPLYPPTPLQGADATAVNALNEIIRGYGVARTSAQLTLSEDSIPALGADDAATRARRTESFFRSCIPDAEEATKAPRDLSTRSRVLANAMRCGRCHDDTTAGRLLPPLSKQVFDYVREGHMPTGSALSAEDRGALVSCLRQEYTGTPEDAPASPGGTLFAYLTGVRCDTPPPTPVPGKEPVRKDHLDDPAP